MTKPKFRPCPSCQVRQQANRKTCSACFATLPSKRLLKTAKINDDWGQRVIKNKNASRVVASAQIAVQKLSALGYMPILFISQRHKGTGKLMADVVTHLPPTQNNTRFLTSMKRAYDFMIKLDDVSQPQQDQPLDQPQQDQPLDQPQQDQPLDQPQQDQPLDQLIPQDHQLITLELCPIVSQAQQHVELLPPRKRQTPPSSPGQDRQAPPSIQPQLKKRQTTGTGATQAPPSTLAKKKKTKSCKCSRQTIYPYDKILERRMNGGKAAEVKVRWLPCSSCGRVWEDTWEPASKFA
ncbi:uncharacterized protein LOC113051877 isoform X1 [Carassius auratus]|uniref:Uncharacterized protein LOC113051877 isoform X1 n=1 Tax=Carassius auratus TaxID=7957 RepID=A0A6P6KI14_CARAU|nr:uncharacterized protein LOC113051877 isoform X1 [Carassius auratus]